MTDLEFSLTNDEKLWYHQAHRSKFELENYCMKGKCQICRRYS